MAKKSNFNFNDLSTWTLPVVLIASVVIIGGIGYLAKTFLVSDVTILINKQNAIIDKEEKIYAENKKIVVLLPHVQREVEQLEIVRDRAKKFLPTNVSMPSLILHVYKSASDNSIVFNKFTPQADIDTKYYIIKPINLSADIGFMSMATFIEKVTTLERIMNVHSVNFTTKVSFKKRNAKSVTGESNKLLTMTAQLRTYIFKEQMPTK